MRVFVRGPEERPSAGAARPVAAACLLMLWLSLPGAPSASGQSGDRSAGDETPPAIPSRVVRSGPKRLQDAGEMHRGAPATHAAAPASAVRRTANGGRLYQARSDPSRSVTIVDCPACERWAAWADPVLWLGLPYAYPAPRPDRPRARPPLRREPTPGAPLR